MKKTAQTLPHSRRGGESGYAILMVLFLATLLLLGTMAIGPSILTEGRREKEKELVWRGNQYKRGIRMYYRKTGKFPKSVEDLTKPQLGNLRFMRQVYKDPMNNKDGSWRLIYVGPAGQLIGSLKPQRALQLTGVGAFQGITPATAPTAGGLGGQQVPGAAFGQSLGQPFGSTNGLGGSQLGTVGGAPALGGAPGTQLPGSVSTDTSLPGTSADTDSANEALINSPDPPAVIGGNIIGVGSKMNQPSFLIYDKAKNYRQFEFIWDPSQDPLIKVGNIGQIGAPAGALGQPGTAGPAGLNPGLNPTSPLTPNNPVNPQPLPPDNAPAPNPPPQP